MEYNKNLLAQMNEKKAHLVVGDNSVVNKNRRDFKPSKKLKLAIISMEGNVVHWFQNWRQKSKIHLGKNFSKH